MPRRAMLQSQKQKKETDAETKEKRRENRKKDSEVMDEVDLNDDFNIPKHLEIDVDDLALFENLEKIGFDLKEKINKAEQKV